MADNLAWSEWREHLQESLVVRAHKASSLCLADDADVKEVKHFPECIYQLCDWTGTWPAKSVDGDP